MRTVLKHIIEIIIVLKRLLEPDRKRQLRYLRQDLLFPVSCPDFANSDQQALVHSLDGNCLIRLLASSSVNSAIGSLARNSER